MRLLSLFQESEIKDFLRNNKFDILDLFISNQVVNSLYTEIFERIYLFSNFLILGLKEEKLETLISGKIISVNDRQFVYIAVFAVRNQVDINFNYWSPFQSLLNKIFEITNEEITFVFFHYNNSIIKFLSLLIKTELSVYEKIANINPNTLKQLLAGFFSDSVSTFNFSTGNIENIIANELYSNGGPKLEAFIVGSRIRFNNHPVYKKFLKCYSAIVQKKRVMENSDTELSEKTRKVAFVLFDIKSRYKHYLKDMLLINSSNKKSKEKVKPYSPRFILDLVKLVNNLNCISNENVKFLSYLDIQNSTLQDDVDSTFFLFISEKAHYSWINKFCLSHKFLKVFNFELDQKRVIKEKRKNGFTQIITAPFLYSYHFKNKVVMIPSFNIENGFLDSTGLANFALDILRAKDNSVIIKTMWQI